MTATATILRFNEVLRLFTAFLFDMDATSGPFVGFVLPVAYEKRGLKIDCVAACIIGINRADEISGRSTSKLVYCQGFVSMVADFTLGQRGFLMPVFRGIEKARMRSVPCHFAVKVPPLVLQGCRC